MAALLISAQNTSEVAFEWNTPNELRGKKTRSKQVSPTARSWNAIVSLLGSSP